MLASLRQERRRVGAFIGGFEAGLANRRLKGFQPSRAHLNTLIAAAGPDITARARWLVRNNGYAANAIESWAGNVVGRAESATISLLLPSTAAEAGPWEATAKAEMSAPNLRTVRRSRSQCLETASGVFMVCPEVADDRQEFSLLPRKPQKR